MISYQELKRLMQLHKVKSCADYLSRRHNILPESVSDPKNAYKNEWEGWGPFLGKDGAFSAPPVEGFLSYKEAKALLMEVGFKGGRREYAEQCKKISERLPTSAQKYYSGDWTTWSDYLNNGFVCNSLKAFLSFDDAVASLKDLNIESAKEYNKKYKSLDGNYPAAPTVIYSKEWRGWHYFLSKPKKADLDQYKPLVEFFVYEQASEFCQNNNVLGQSDYQQRYKELSFRLPSSPDIHYKSKGWSGWKQFLNTVMFDYDQARACCSDHKIISSVDYKIRRPDMSRRLPFAPSTYYQEWSGWDNFLNKPKMVTDYQLAKKTCQDAGIKSMGEYRLKYKDLVVRLPSSPNLFYSEWVSWPDFFKK